MTSAHAKRDGSHVKTQEEEKEPKPRREDFEGAAPTYTVVSDFQPTKL